MPTTGGLDPDGVYHPTWSPAGRDAKVDPPGKKAEARRLTRVRRFRYYPVRIVDGADRGRAPGRAARGGLTVRVAADQRWPRSITSGPGPSSAWARMIATTSSGSSVIWSRSMSLSDDGARRQERAADPVEQARPVRRADQHDREVADLAGLDERERLEQLVERPEPAGQDDEAVGVLHEHRLAREEVAELDPEVDVRG